MSKKDDSRLVIGGSPRANLLPPEIRQLAKARSQRRGLLFILGLVLAIVVAGYVASTLYANESRVALAAELARSEQLLGEKAEYISVSQLEAQLQVAEDARALAVSTEVNWSEYVAALQSRLPAGMTILGFTSNTATPAQPFTPPTAPLLQPRVGEITLTTTSADIPSVAPWLASIKTVTGTADVTLNTVTFQEGAYISVLTIHINEEAFANRFAETDDEETSP